MSVSTSSLPIKPIWALNLTHAATNVTATPGAKRIAINTEGPFISVADFGESRIQTIQLHEPARHVAINSNGDLLAVASASNTVAVLTLESGRFGQALYRFEEAAHDVCAFSRDGKLLWTVGLIFADFAEIRCYEVGSWNLIAQQRFKPLVGGCGFVLTLHPTNDVLGLWVCGGPDHAWTYWLELTTNGIEVEYQPALDRGTPPSFNSRGDRFVSLNDYELAAFSFPNCRQLYQPRNAMDENQDDSFAESLCYLDSTENDRVLAATNEGRMFVLSLGSGRIIAEVLLEGHEPKPCYQVYTSLSQSDDRLCSDLHFFGSVGSNLILSVHTNGRASNRRDAILLWNVDT
jgi:hypothetical protein